MKNFTCLVVALLAIGMINAQTSATATGLCAVVADHTLATRLNTLGGANTYLGPATSVVTTDATCDAIGKFMCCDQAKIKIAISAELNLIKTALVDAGASASRLGTNWAKIMALAGSQNASVTSASDADRSLIPAATLNAISMWPLSSLDADFKGFLAQVPTCFGNLSLFTHRLTCFACTAAADATATATKIGLLATDTKLSITAGTCTMIVTACGKVFNFLHRFGWFVHAIAYIHKKKDNNVAFADNAADFNNYYAPGAKTSGSVMTWANIDESVTKCNAEPLTATCDAAAQAFLCRAFVAPYAPLTSPGVGSTNPGRSSSQYFKAPYDFYSKGRRALAAAATAYEVAISAATGAMELSTGTWSNAAVTIPLTTAITLVAADTTAWSTGYMAPVAGAGGNNTTGNNTSANNTSSNSTASKSAKIVFGTIISAILAVALLN